MECQLLNAPLCIAEPPSYPGAPGVIIRCVSVLGTPSDYRGELRLASFELLGQ